MKVSTEINNNFGYEKITQLVDNIPLNSGGFQNGHISFNLSVLKYAVFSIIFMVREQRQL
jgi:hypothetical protein